MENRAIIDFCGKMPTVRELDELLERYPWFTAARVLRSRLSGQPDPRLLAVEADRGRAVEPAAIDVEALLQLSADDIIDRFLKEKELRIVAEEGEPDQEIVTEADLDDDDDLVTEELAEVYLNQGMKQQALAIYRKLSLLIPEKSVYFAEIIEKLETNN